MPSNSYRTCRRNTRLRKVSEELLNETVDLTRGRIGARPAYRRRRRDRAGERTTRRTSQPGANGAIGSIDMEEVYNASGSPQELEQAARQHEAEGAQRITKIMAVPYLEHNELEEYGTLIGKAKMTPDEEKRAAVLKGISATKGR